MHTVLLCTLIITITHSAYEWPSEYPELDVDILREELCPWDTTKQCYIFGKDKEINHPVLNGMIDCDSKEYDKNLGIIKRHYGKPLYKSSSNNKCEIQDIFQILCKAPPDDAQELKNKYASLSRFFFLPKTPLKTSRDSKSFNLLANKLATPRLVFSAIGVESPHGTMTDFETIPKSLKSYLDYFYRKLYISGSAWNMNRDKRKYNDIKQELDLFLSPSDYQQIINDGKELYFKAFDCDYECKRNNERILYYNALNDLKLNVELDGESCLKRKHQCTPRNFERDQSSLTSWTPANFAFIEIESAFRIKYADHWIKNEMNPKPIPIEYTTNQFINNGMEIQSTSIIIPFELKLKSKYLDHDAMAQKRGFTSNPLNDLESKQRIKFMGTLSTTQIFNIKGKKENDLQITKKHEDQYVVSPIFPPLSEIEITWILYNWRFCWIKDFGADKPIKLYAQPPDIIVFSDLIQDSSTGIWEMQIQSALHDDTFKMPTYSQIRIYPNCGDAIGKTTDDKDPCTYVYFYDATRIDYNQIEQWNGAEFSPKIDEEYQYLLLESSGKKEFKLGMIVNPSLGSEAVVNINFDLETNDWKNIYILPLNTEIETKLLFSENNNAPVTLIAPKLLSQDDTDPIAMGLEHCFNFNLKSKSKSKSVLQIADRIYVRPIIFPTNPTVERWLKDGYKFDNKCTAGFTLLSVNAQAKQVSHPGLMHFTLGDYQSKTLEFGSFCIYFKLYGEYRVFYEIGSKHWYSRDTHLISYKNVQPLIKGTADEITTAKQLAGLKKIDRFECYEHQDGFYFTENPHFPQKTYLALAAPKNARISRLKVEKPGAVSFEIREFPKPLKIGDTTDWITIHVSRAPFNGVFILQPYCETESKLRFEFQQNANNFYELMPVQSEGKIEPFAFKMKITAPNDLQCFGHFPYKIDWRVKQDVIDPVIINDNDDINNPPSIFLMVIANDFDAFDVHDTANGDQEIVGDKTYEDGMADPKCVEKYSQREQDEEDMGSKGPNGQLAPPLNEMKQKMDTGYMAAGGDNYDAQEFLKPVTVSDTIHNPAQLIDYLKDYDKLKGYICEHQPEHELCGGNKTETVKSDGDGSIPAMSPTIPASKPLGLWSWQNIVVYVACIVIVIGIIKTLGCFEKSLESKIIEAQMRAMQPLNDVSNE